MPSVVMVVVGKKEVKEQGQRGSYISPDGLRTAVFVFLEPPQLSHIPHIRREVFWQFLCWKV